jgi:hypothetical protein
MTGATLVLLAAAAAWAPPKDGLLGDKQVRLYQQVSEIARRAMTRQGDESAPQLIARMNKLVEAALAERGSSAEEFRWIGERITEAQAYAAVVAARAKGIDAAAFGRKARELLRAEAGESVDEMASIWENEIARVAALIGTPAEARLQRNLVTLKKTKDPAR